MSASSSPSRATTLFYSAPASPTRISPLYDEFNWEEISKGKHNPDEDDEDFAFDFSGQLERISLSATDELFDYGKIKPLKPPPRSLQSLKLCSLMVFLGEKNFKQRIGAVKLEEGEEISEEIATIALRRSVNFFSALQATDGHWPAENSGPLFFLPPLVM
ncbi:hypothetical protein KY284_010932 [Solanum tuberosum]|nr:hypothetical protein KY284_010932 [Solanum tuberosum]